MDLDTINKMYVALANGKTFEEAGLPDTAEMRARWAVCIKDRDDIKARGGTVDLPHDLPDRSERITDEYLDKLTVGKK